MDPLRQATDFHQTAADAAREKRGEATASAGDVRSGAVARVLHELQVHQVELEMQNEELLRSRLALEESRSRYYQLYHEAPVAYVTLNDEGLILELNRVAGQLLGASPASLVMSRFSSLVAQDSQDGFHLHRKRLREEGGTQACELQMLRADGSIFWAGLKCSVGVDADGGPVCRAVLSDISEQRLSYEALVKAEDFTSSLIRLMQDGLSVIDPKGVAMDANPAMCAMTGFSREELVGIGPPHPYWPPEEYSRIHDALESTLNGSGSNVELTFMRKSGERFPVIVSAFVVSDRHGRTIAFAATVKDISLRKQLEQTVLDWNQQLEIRVAERTAELRQSEERFRQLTEATFEGIAISENGIIIDGNTQFAAMYGFTISEMIGRPVVDFVAPESRETVFEHIRANSEEAYEFIGMRGDGTRIPMEAQGRMMRWEGKASRVTALRDLTSRKEFEAKLRNQRKELDQARRLAIIGEISSGIIHQLGQPLAAMGVNITVAMARYEGCGEQTGEIGDILRDIESDMVRMRKCMRHLRALAYPEDAAGRSLVELSALVGTCLRIFKADIESQRMHVAVEIDREPPRVLADEVQLSQVILNLVRNALEACRDCPPERRKIAITMRELAGELVELCVRDAGAGIPPDAMERIFTPFFSTKSEGLGIGLRLCKTIVEAHGGHIEGFNNVGGEGATFRVLLPARPKG